MPSVNNDGRSSSTIWFSKRLKRIKTLLHLKPDRKCRGIAECRTVIEGLWNESFHTILESNGWPEMVIEHLTFISELHKLAALTKNDFPAAKEAINIARMESEADGGRLTGTVGQIAQEDVRLAIVHVVLERERPVGRPDGLTKAFKVKDNMLAKKDSEILELQRRVQELDQENNGLRDQIRRMEEIRRAEEVRRIDSPNGEIVMSDACRETDAAEAALRCRGRSNSINAF
ncbi:uncharacterized protein K452DRAFT_331146 [Aplosporella prunicola CBS 121167]|uniref:Uncharacterized protein n=1 Tax=Aplosporella prunicola CBS 121167 TaxID=1176127 RepID=A0A6A6BTZ3_9PEZI|nr:uncharacterized protein K452DRAFT_331146 [Aplosporella prunicola CBS 121167]KAF2147556.1 hypothetical protein K452DRAFT_331146 [Aplosporella prunicola CBS 121167]